MTIRKFCKKYIFVFLLFLVQELFMNLIGEYNKTFMWQSFAAKKYFPDMLLTLFLYNLFVFTVTFVIFFMYLKKQSLLYDFKRKLLCFVGVAAGYEGCKLIAYLIIRDKTQSIYFILGNAFLAAVQITIFQLFNGIDNFEQDEKPSIRKKNIIAASILTIAATVFIIIYEVSLYNSQGSDMYIRSRFFVCGFWLAIFTAIIQTVFFGGVMNEELPETIAVKRQSILLVGLAGMAFILWLVKLALPEGVLAGGHEYRSSGAEKWTGEDEFGITYTENETYRCVDQEKSAVYYKKTADIYYGKDKVCSYICTDPSKSRDEYYFEDENYRGIVVKDSVIVYRTKDGELEYCAFGDKQSDGYDKSVYRLVLRSAQSKDSSMRFYNAAYNEVEGMSDKVIFP